VRRYIVSVLLLAMTMLLCVLTMTPSLDTQAETLPSEISIVEQDGKEWLNIDDNLCIFVDSVTDAADSVRQDLENHTDFIRIAYGAEEIPDPVAVWNQIDQAVYGQAGKDYLKLLSSADQIRIVETDSIARKGSKVYKIVYYECRPDYYASPKENAQAEEEMDRVLADLSLQGDSDYTKIKKIYHYICSNISYDWDFAPASFSAYGALVNKKAVCQGYAMLLYQLSKKAGLAGGIVCGKAKDSGESVDHAWNVVKVEGAYYYLDATWDGTMSRCSYFLRGSDRFLKDHTGTGGYTVSKADYVLPEEDKYWFDSTYKPQVRSISLSGISHKIAGGKTVKLTAIITPSYAPKTVKWTSSNKKVATVTSSGKVKVKKGAAGKTVTIWAKAANGKKASWKIKVMKGVVKKISIKGAKKDLETGTTLQLKAVVKATKKANTAVKWTSSDKEAASVTGKGLVKALKKGCKVRITAMATDGSGRKKYVDIYTR